MPGQDILYKQDGPTSSLQVHSGPVHCLAAHPAGQHVLAGCEDGGVVMIEMSHRLTSFSRAERVSGIISVDSSIKSSNIKHAYCLNLHIPVDISK